MQEQSQNLSEEVLHVEDKTLASGETMTAKEALYKLLESQSDCV
jgi:hypothetical protein